MDELEEGELSEELEAKPLRPSDRLLKNIRDASGAVEDASAAMDVALIPLAESNERKKILELLSRTTRSMLNDLEPESVKRAMDDCGKAVVSLFLSMKPQQPRESISEAKRMLKTAETAILNLGKCALCDSGATTMAGCGCLACDQCEGQWCRVCFT